MAKPVRTNPRNATDVASFICFIIDLPELLRLRRQIGVLHADVGRQERPTAPVFERDAYAVPEQEAVAGPRAFFSSLATLNRAGGHSDVWRLSAQDWQPDDPASRIPLQAVAPTVATVAIL